MTSRLDEPRLGEGVYTFPEAAEILGGVTRQVSARQLRYWMTTGLAPASHVDRDDGEPILSFEDLISLEVVRRFRVEGASLQGVRVVESVLREYYPDYHRPFAHEVFFTDGADVWAEVEDGDGRLVIELRGRRRHHYAWRDAVATFATEIHFEGPERRAYRWELSPWVEIDPRIQFGQPVVADTRVKVETVAANLEVATPGEVADWYGLTAQQVEGVRDYLAAH